MEAERRQHILWKEPEVSSFPSSGLHSKVNRTYSVSLGGLPPHWPLTHLPINHRSSPDGSAAEVEPGHLSATGGKQIDERAFLTTDVGIQDDDDVKKKAIDLRSQPPQSDSAAGDGPSTAAVTQPYLGHNGDYSCSPNRDDMEPASLELDPSDVTYSPVASESRGELLQCEGGSVALEDVLRHYWLLSDRDDELPKRRDNHRTMGDDDTAFGGFDWSSKRSDVNGDYRKQPGLSDWIIRGPEIMLPLDRDDDADSIVTLSTISEENSEDLSSAAEAQNTTRMNENGGQGFCSNQGDVTSEDLEDDMTDVPDEDGVDFLSDKEGFDLQSDPSIDFSTQLEEANPMPEPRSAITRHPDGVEDDLSPPSPSMMDSFVRSFSDYLGDIYPFSPAFVSPESNVYVGEGNSRHTESDPSLTPDPVDSYNEYTVTDTLVHIKLVSSLDDQRQTDFSRCRDQATNTVADHNSEMVWSPSDLRSSITSPTSWYTVSDFFDSQSFETASEMAEDDSGETAGSKANAKCTAVARCLASSPQPCDLPPSSSVSINVSASDPFVAIGTAAARAASLAASRAVRGWPTSENHAGDFEVVVTTTCVLNRSHNSELTDGNSDEDGVYLLKTDAAVETRSCSVDVAIQASFSNNSYDYGDGFIDCDSLLQEASGKHFRISPSSRGIQFAEAENTEDGAVSEWSSAVDEAAQGTYTCSVAVPPTGPDADVKPHVDEASHLPAANGIVTNDHVKQDFEVTSVAIKEPARKTEGLLQEKTAGHKTKESGTDVTRIASHTASLVSTEHPAKFDTNLQGSDKTAEEHFQRTLKPSGYFEKPGDTAVATENRDLLQQRDMEILRETSHEKPYPLGDSGVVELNQVLGKTDFTEPGIDTCNYIPKSGIANVPLERRSPGETLQTAPSSHNSQQSSKADEKSESQNEYANKLKANCDKNIGSEGETASQDTDAKKASDTTGRTCHSPSPQHLLSDAKNDKLTAYFRVRKSQSLLLETDIDTLEHRRTPVARKVSHGLVPEAKSCTDLSSSRVSQYKPPDFPCSFGRGTDTLMSKEALAEILSNSASASSLVKKRLSWGASPQTVGHCFSEPSLQLSSCGEPTSSSIRNSIRRRSTGMGHLTERLSSGTRWRIFRSQETVSTKKQLMSCPNWADKVNPIERYEQSPSLRRRSLHIIEASQQRRDPETATVQRSQSYKTPPSQTFSSDTSGLKRHSSSPASSSFENLVDSLLGITAVMSMGAAVSHTRSSYVVIPSDSPKSPSGQAAKNLDRSISEPASTSATQSDEKKTRFETGNEARPVDHAIDPLVDTSGSPVHSIPTPRKHVHFRKAKHIFRKCHFCIDSSERKSGPPTPTKSPGHEAAKKKSNSKKGH